MAFEGVGTEPGCLVLVLVLTCCVDTGQVTHLLCALEFPFLKWIYK